MRISHIYIFSAWCFGNNSFKSDIHWEFCMASDYPHSLVLLRSHYSGRMCKATESFTHKNPPELALGQEYLHPKWRYSFMVVEIHDKTCSLLWYIGSQYGKPLNHPIILLDQNISIAVVTETIVGCEMRLYDAKKDTKEFMC